MSRFLFSCTLEGSANASRFLGGSFSGRRTVRRRRHMRGTCANRATEIQVVCGFPTQDVVITPVAIDKKREVPVPEHHMMADVAVLMPGDGLEDKAAILLREPSVRSVAVFSKTGEAAPHLQWVAGDPCLEIMYMECGVRFKLDLAQRASRLQKSQGSFHERKRVRELVQEGERILVLGAGFGLTSMLLGKLTHCAEVVGVDPNPSACAFAEINAKLNQCEFKVSTVMGDPMDANLLNSLGTFDRVIAYLPWKRQGVVQTLADLAVPCIPLIAPRGAFHIYTHETADALNAGPAVNESLLASVSGGRKFELTWYGKAQRSSIGMRLYRVGWDFSFD